MIRMLWSDENLEQMEVLDVPAHLQDNLKKLSFFYKVFLKKTNVTKKIFVRVITGGGLKVEINGLNAGSKRRRIATEEIR